MFQVGYADLVIAAIPIHNRGVAGSLVAVTRTMGVVAGAAGISAFFARAHLIALTIVPSRIWLAKRLR
jgi:hypothetical protein